MRLWGTTRLLPRDDLFFQRHLNAPPPWKFQSPTSCHPLADLQQHARLSSVVSLAGLSFNDSHRVCRFPYLLIFLSNDEQQLVYRQYGRDAFSQGPDSRCFDASSAVDEGYVSRGLIRQIPWTWLKQVNSTESVRPSLAGRPPTA